MFKALIFTTLLFTSSLYAAEKIEASSTQNPAPTVKLSDFDRIEISNVALPSPYDKQEINVAGQESVQLNFELRTLRWLLDVNARPLAGPDARILLVEPIIAKIKSVSTTARVWGGAFAGSSRILITMKLTDKNTGAIIANPEFYQHANAFAGAYTIGAADKAMLERVTALMADYLKNNYVEAVGGPTGMEAK